MTPEKKRTAQRWAALALLVPLLAGLLAWTAKAYDATNVSVTRFVSDSIATAAKQESSDQTIRSDLVRLRDVICLDHPRAPQCQ